MPVSQRKPVQTKMETRSATKARARLRDDVPAGSTYCRQELLQFCSGDTREFRVLVDVGNVGAARHDNHGKGHCETRELVNNAHSGVLPVDNRCSIDSWCVLKVTGDEFMRFIPERGQTHHHLALIKDSGLADEDIGGLADCQRVFGSEKEALTRMSCKKLLTCCFRFKKNKAGIVTALLALDLAGIFTKIREGNSTKLLDRVRVLTTRETDKNRTAKEHFVLLLPFFGCLLCQREKEGFCLFPGSWEMPTFSPGVWI